MEEGLAAVAEKETETDAHVAEPAGDEMPADGALPQPPTGAPMDESTGEQLTITGGTLVVNAGGDGIDSNGDFSMTGGTATVNGPENGGNGALDVAGEMSVTGGTLAALGSAGMAQDPTTGQGWVQANVSATAGDTIQIADSSGATVATLTATKTVGNVEFSSPDIVEGETYIVGDVETTAGTSTGGGMGGPGGMPGLPGNDEATMPRTPGASGMTGQERSRRPGHSGGEAVTSS